MKKEIRNFNFEVRAKADEERGNIIEGRAIVYDEATDMGWYQETIESGALDSADLKDVRLLINHNVDMIPLARSRNNTDNSTMKLSIVPEGLDIRADLDTENNSEAKNLYSAIERGDISGMSFMFGVDGDRWEDIDSDYPKRYITSISKVFEVSAVTFPAYEQTTLEARGLSDALESAKESLDSVVQEKRAVERQKQKIRMIKEIISC